MEAGGIQLWKILKNGWTLKLLLKGGIEKSFWNFALLDNFDFYSFDTFLIAYPVLIFWPDIIFVFICFLSPKYFSFI